MFCGQGDTVLFLSGTTTVVFCCQTTLFSVVRKILLLFCQGDTVLFLSGTMTVVFCCQRLHSFVVREILLLFCQGDTVLFLSRATVCFFCQGLLFLFVASIFCQGVLLIFVREITLICFASITVHFLTSTFCLGFSFPSLFPPCVSPSVLKIEYCPPAPGI